MFRASKCNVARLCDTLQHRDNSTVLDQYRMLSALDFLYFAVGQIQVAPKVNRIIYDVCEDPR